MKALATLLLVLGFAAPAAAGEFGPEIRPQVTFPGPNGGIVHQSPYPQSNRSATIWNGDACWRECKTSCTWKMDACVRSSSTVSANADQCRPSLDACDRSCQRSCRTWWQGPLLGFVDF
jgi:hypothetical protein